MDQLEIVDVDLRENGTHPNGRKKWYNFGFG